ncbi:MAG: MFS transporter [Deltaproteobacteria bacterium]|nr:MFS transporter [Deltaproteobacteria bacterium]
MPAPTHSPEFRRRRFLNWFPLGLAYAFLYMGRYSYIPAKSFMTALIDDQGLGTVGMVGAWTYGLSFLLNGPLTERLGGRFAMLVATAGSSAVNLVIGAILSMGWTDRFLATYCVLTAINMYFQSWAAIAIVKVNGSWFHVRERGAFGGIFGIMISSGLFLAYTVSPVVTKNLFGSAAEYYFLMPGALLMLFFAATFIFVHDTPEDAGLGPFDAGSSDEFDSGNKASVVRVLGKLLTHPVVLTIALIEFCTGVLRNGLMYWYPIWSREHSAFPALADWQGVGLFAAGVFGGLTAGFLSDRVFGSRRGPVAGLLYGVMIVLLGAMALAMSSLGGTTAQAVTIFAALVIGSFCVIGTHGVLSGTATADFGGKGATAMAVGIIDGFVYLGVGVQSAALGRITKHGWAYWPLFLIPFAVIGLLLALRIWNALPKRTGGH